MTELLDDKDLVEEQEEQTEQIDKVLYDKAIAEAEKYKGYFKKEKAKQNKSPDKPDTSSLKQEIMQELKFYTGNPQAEQYKEQIEEYVGKGLSYDEAYRLTASKENPQLLLDKQTQAKQEVGNKTLTGVGSDGVVGTDYSKWNDQDIQKATDEEMNGFWEFNKSK